MDISVAWNNERLRGDWIIAGGGFQTDAGLRTAVLVSYFTNRRAPDDWNPPAGSPPDRGGYFGDSYTKRPLGSWLWLLYRSGIGDKGAVLAQVKNYCETALAWLIEDGIATSVTVTTGWAAPEAVGIVTIITRPSGQVVPPFKYSWLWQGA